MELSIPVLFILLSTDGAYSDEVSDGGENVTIRFKFL